METRLEILESILDTVDSKGWRYLVEIELKRELQELYEQLESPTLNRDAAQSIRGEIKRIKEIAGWKEDYHGYYQQEQENTTES